MHTCLRRTCRGQRAMCRVCCLLLLWATGTELRVSGLAAGPMTTRISLAPPFSLFHLVFRRHLMRPTLANNWLRSRRLPGTLGPPASHLAHCSTGLRCGLCAQAGEWRNCRDVLRLHRMANTDRGRSSRAVVGRAGSSLTVGLPHTALVWA